MSLKNSISKNNFSIQTANIKIHQIQIPVFIGYFEWERRQKQNLSIDLNLSIDNSLPWHSDDLNQSVDYGPIIEKVFQACDQKTFFLLEKVAHTILKCLFENSRILSAKISVTKTKPLAQCQAISMIFFSKNDSSSLVRK